VSTPELARGHEQFADLGYFVESATQSKTIRPGTNPGILYATTDGLAVVGTGLLAYHFREVLCSFIGVDPSTIGTLPHARLLVFLAVYAGLTIICNAAHDLYSKDSPHSGQFAKLIKSFFLASLIAVMVVFVAGDAAMPRLLFASTAVFGMFELVTLRYLIHTHTLKRIDRGLGTRHVLIVGSGKIGRAFHHYLQTHRQLGKKVCGFVDDEPCDSPLWLGMSTDLPRIVQEQFIDEIYFTPDASRDLIIDIALQAREQRISVKVVPDLYGGLALGAGLTRIGDIPVLELNHQPIPAIGLFFKRLIDLVVATVLGLLSAPIMAVTAALIKLTSHGPVLYTAWRVGRKGRKFRCYKFRTMVEDADALKDELRHLNERNGATFKIENDPRITQLGRFLRKFSIDEFPQLINVVKGDMSMVGPRPHPLDDYHQYRLEDLRRLDVLPGITGLWQVSARRDPSFEKNVLLDLEYINNWNLALDVKILVKTVQEVLRGSGR
jgi:exopolysaccharide biosynthesis polyprenyl glycosylphosphotransferase